MKVFHVLSEYRWPIFVGGLLAMSIASSGVIVYVATRHDSPLPIRDYYESARSWDADEAVRDASRELGWTVGYELPGDVPHYAGMPRPVDVSVTDREGRPVTGLSGRLFAIRPADSHLNQDGALVEIPQHPGRYRTLVRMDVPGVWELRLDTHQQALRFVHAARVTVAPDAPGGESR